MTCHVETLEVPLAVEIAILESALASAYQHEVRAWRRMNLALQEHEDAGRTIDSLKTAIASMQNTLEKRKKVAANDGCTNYKSIREQA